MTGASPAVAAQDRLHCLELLLARTEDAVLDAQLPGQELSTFITAICRSAEFQSTVLAPLMLGEPLPHERLAPAPTSRLLEWLQRRLPLLEATRLAAGAAGTWAHLLELLFSDERFLDGLPEFRAAEIDRVLAERVGQGPLAGVRRRVVGAIDAISGMEIRGWAFDLCGRGPVTLEFHADNLFLGRVQCSEPRPDVQEIVGGDGSSGFYYRIPAVQRAHLGNGRMLTVVDAVSRAPIGTPVLVRSDIAAGADVLGAALGELRDIRSALERLESRLPDLSRLASVPVEAYAEYWRRFYAIAPDVARQQRVRAGALAYAPTISVIMPTWNSDGVLLREAVASVLAQTYPNWELVVSDDASTAPDDWRRLRSEYAADARIHWIEGEQRAGIAANTNRALAAARGDYVAFLDHDDILAIDALYEVVAALQQRNYGLLYSDEDRIEADGIGGWLHHTPFFKPGLDPDLLRSMNYICHLVVMRASLLRELGGLRDGFEGAQDHDLLLRAIASLAPHDVHHIPRILYHWRVTPGSVSRQPESQALIEERIVAAVNAQLRASGCAARAEPHHDPLGVDRAFATRVRWQLPNPAPSVAIVIPTRDRLDLLEPCIASVLECAAGYPGVVEVLVIDNDSAEAATHAYLGHIGRNERVRVVAYHGAFNWSAINNFAARASGADILVFLNNDTLARDRDWIAELAAQAVRGDVGAVGARLIYADGTIQHAGVVLGVEGVAGHDGVGSALADGGYFGRSHLLRSAAAVTGACLATRRSVFEQVGGFDAERLKVAFNDVDYCMKVRAAGLRVVYDPFATLFHFESKSRGKEITPAQQARFGAEASAFCARWGEEIRRDPYYNMHFERYALPFDRLRPPMI